MQDEFTNVGWETGAANNEIGFAAGKKNGMTINVPANPELQADLLEISSNVIVPWWTERVGAEGEQKFYDIIGPIVGVEKP